MGKKYVVHVHVARKEKRGGAGNAKGPCMETVNSYVYVSVNCRLKFVQHSMTHVVRHKQVSKE